MSNRRGRVMRIDSSSEESGDDDSVIIESSDEEVVQFKEKLSSNSNNSPSVSCIPASPDIFDESTEVEEEEEVISKEVHLPNSREGEVKEAPRSSSTQVQIPVVKSKVLESELELEFAAKAKIFIPVVDLEETLEEKGDFVFVEPKLAIPSTVLKNNTSINTNIEGTINMEDYHKRFGPASASSSSEGSFTSARNGTAESVTSTPFLSSSRKALDLNMTAIPHHAEGRIYLNSSDEENDKKSESEDDNEDDGENTPKLERYGAVGGDRNQNETLVLQPRKLYQNVNDGEHEESVEILSNNIDKLNLEKPKPVEKVHPFAKFDPKATHKPLVPRPLAKFIDFDDLPEISKRPQQQPSMPFMNPETKKGVHGTIELLYKIIEDMPKEKDCVEDKDPRGLKVDLFTHQKFGVKWLHWKENSFPGGGILADEMGLGKTLMIIGLILKAKQEGKKEESASQNNGWISTEKNRRLVPSKSTLVVCPASVLEQWENEVKTKARGLRAHIFHGPKRTSHSSQLVQNDIVITTYQTLGSEIPKTTETNHTVTSPLLRINWERVVLDEGHQIRNRKTLAAQACYQLNARYRWVVTGTPVHNSPSDMHSLVQFLRLTPFSDEKGMKLTRGKDNLERLQTITKTILLRRTKDEVRENGGAVGNLPPKTIEDIVIDLNENERKIYDHLDQFAKIEFRAFLNQRKERELQNAANEFMAGGGRGRGERKFRDAEEKTFTHIFTLILRLRQASVLPFLIHSMLEDEGTSDDIVVENEDALKELDDDDIISKKNPAFNGDFESAKLQRVYQDLEEIRTKCIEEDRAMDKVIIVSQWTTLLDVVYYQLKKRGFSITQLTGKTPIGDRMEVMSRFNANKRKPQVMLLSLAAGGVGLNLIGANYLFFLDLHWNPQLEFQAQDRIHRFGQTKPVFIRRYIARDTIEAKILELQKAKVELATGIINAKKKTGGALTIADMRMIFGI